MFKRILPQLERLHIGIWELEGDVHDLILKFCSNLRYLLIYQIHSYRIISKGNGWLNRKYPTMEHVLLHDYFGHRGMADEFLELKIFFELNENIQRFSTTFHFLQVNRNSFLNSNIKLKQLDILVDWHFEYIRLDDICRLLNDLHQQGFYQRLFLSASSIYEQEELNQIALIRGLKKLYLVDVSTETIAVLPPMPELNDLWFRFGVKLKDLDSVVRSLLNVNRVHFDVAKANCIASLVRYAPQVKEVKVKKLREGAHFEDGVIDLFALNRDRKRLVNACKITIYVNENIFLSTKRVMGKTELGLITLKRAEAIKWTNVFEG